MILKVLKIATDALSKTAEEGTLKKQAKKNYTP